VQGDNVRGRGRFVLSKIKSLSLYIFVIFAFVGGMIAFLLFLRPNPEQVKLAITEYFQETTGCLIQMDAVRPDGVLLPAIWMSGLSLYATDGEEVAKLRWLQADLSVSDLISGGIGLSSIHLVEPEFKFHSFDKCFNKMHLPARQVGGQAAQVDIRIEKAMLNWSDNPLPEMQRLSFPALEGQWDGTKNLKLFGHIQGLSDAQKHPVHMSMRMGENAVDRLSFDFLEETDAPLVNARKVSTYVIRPQKQTGHFSLNVDTADWVSFLADTPFAKEAFKLEADINLNQDGIGFDNLEGQIGEESFQGQMNLHIQEGTASFMDASFEFGILDKDIATTFSETNAAIADFSKLASRLALAPFEIDLGITASGLAAEDGEMARAPNIHMIAGLGSVTLDQFNLGLPGGTELSLLADFVPDPAGEDAWFASGGLSLQSSNLRRSLLWLGQDVSEIEPALLRQFSLTTNFEMDAGRWAINDLDIKLDQSTGGGRVEYVAQHSDEKQKILSAMLDFQKLDLDSYLGKDDFALSEYTERLKAQNMDLRVDLYAEDLRWNEQAHPQFEMTLNSDRDGLDITVQNLVLGQAGKLNLDTALDWSQQDFALTLNADYAIDDFTKSLSISETDAALLFGEGKDLIMSWKAQGNFSELSTEISGDIGSTSFAGRSDVSMTAGGYGFEVNDLTIGRDSLMISEIVGRIQLAKGLEISALDLSGIWEEGSIGLIQQSGQDVLQLRLENICNPMMSYQLKEWISLEMCLTELETNIDSAKGLSFKGRATGPLSLEILKDKSELPAGMLDNLAGNILIQLPEETTTYQTDFTYQNETLNLDSIQVSGLETTGHGRLSFNRQINRLMLDMIFKQKGLDQDALDVQASGETGGLNLRLNGRWLAEIR